MTASTFTKAIFGNILTNRTELLSGSSACWGLTAVRFASKRFGGGNRNQGNHARGKHRGWKIQDGQRVQAGKVLATQNSLRFHPGLNVGIGKNLTLFAMESGNIVVTCEKIRPNWDDSWVKLFYRRKEEQAIYKKFFNIVADEQHMRFQLKWQV